MTITVSFTDSKKPEEQILVLHKLLWLHAREVISIDVQNAPSTYSFYSLLKKDIQVEDLDFFIELDINHSILGSIAYQTLFGAETYFPEMHDKPITEKSNHYGDWFNMESYIEAENWIKENKGKVFSPHFDLMQVLPYDGNAKEHLAYLEKLCWLAEKEYVFFSTYSHIDKDYKIDKSFPCLLCSDTFGMACADAESFEKSDIDLIIDMETKFGYKGIVAWISKQRKGNPLLGYAGIDPEEYAKSVEYLENKLL